jgi:DHA2 family multidrug resistance protein
MSSVVSLRGQEAAPPGDKDIVSPAEMTVVAKTLAFTTMVIGMFIALLDIQIVSASLRDIGGGLSAGSDEVTWVQTSYLIAEIIVIPLSGWLSRVMSTRWLFCFSAVGFTLASVACSMAWDINSMIAFRALQGMLGASMIPMVFTTAFAFFQGSQLVVAAATIGAIASLAPTLGPAVGGWITDYLSWPWLFLINVVPGSFVAIAVPMMIKVDKPDWSLLRGADYLGIVLMSLFLGCLEYTLEEGPRWDWFGDSTILATGIVSAVSGVAFIVRSLTFANPVVDLRALKERNFALGSFFSFMTGVGIFSTIYLTPLFLSHVRGYSALQIGEAVLTTGVFQLLSIPFYAMLANRVDLRWLLMIGLGAFGLSMIGFAPITHDWGADQLLLPQAFRGFAQQFAVAPAVTLALGGLPPARLKLASGLFNLMRNLGGAIGIAAMATVINDRTNFHFQRIAEHLTPSNEAMGEMLQRVGGNLAGAGLNLADATGGAVRQLGGLVMREAQTQTFGDTYIVLLVCFMITTAMVPLMRKTAARKAPSADH